MQAELSAGPGEGANVIQFEEGSLGDRLNPAGKDHSLETYFKHYLPPEQAANHPDAVEVPNGGFLDQALRVVTNPVGSLFGFVRGLFS